MNKKDKALLRHLKKTNKIVLLKNGFNLAKVFDKLSEKEKYEADKYVLLKTEDKEKDYLYISEWQKKGGSIFDYETIYDWDKKQWKHHKDSIDEKSLKATFQKKWYKQNFTKYRNLYMLGDFFRWIEESSFGGSKRELVYGELEGLYNYIKTEVDNKLEDLINKKYPNMMYDEYRKPAFSSGVFTYEIRAAGKEKKLKKLNMKKLKKTYLIEKKIEEKIKKLDGYTFVKDIYGYGEDDGKIYERRRCLIVGGIKAAKKIGFDSFLDDFYALQQPYEVIEIVVEQIVKEIKYIIE